MKLTTKEWISAAEDDLLSAKKLAEELRLTNIVAFHCQQCIEKCFKALIEEKLGTSIKSHDLIRLKDKANMMLPEDDITTLATLNEVYIDARYPVKASLALCKASSRLSPSVRHPGRSGNSTK